MRTRTRNVLLSSDYSSQEVKVLAQVSNDREMIGLFEKGLDFYAFVASKAFHLDYNDCLEFLPKGIKVKQVNGDWIPANENDYTDISDGTYVSKIGKKRRTQAKSILLGERKHLPK